MIAAEIEPGEIMRVGLRKALGPAILALVLVLVWFRPLDTLALRYTESGLARAAATFAAARLLNGGIAVLKSTSVSFQIGAGASIQLGAVLEPIDDLLERFSALMLAATLSFATQRLLIEVFGAWPVSVLLSAILVTWISFRLKASVPPRWLSRFALGLLCLRFAVPVVALGSELAYRLVPKELTKPFNAQIESFDASAVQGQAGEGLAEKFKHWWAQTADVGKKIEALKTKADGWVDDIVRSIAVFMLQTVVLPILFLWAMLRLYRALSDTLLVRSSPAAREASQISR